MCRASCSLSAPDDHGGAAVAEPDLGQTILLVAVWCALFFLAGVSTFVVLAVGAVRWWAAAGLFRLSPLRRPHQPLPRPGKRRHVPGGHGHAVIRARRLVGHGTRRRHDERVLPDAHTDFVFAVIGEEFGILLCLLIVACSGCWSCAG
jgi:cell division protein FtsW